MPTDAVGRSGGGLAPALRKPVTGDVHFVHEQRLFLAKRSVVISCLLYACYKNEPGLDASGTTVASDTLREGRRGAFGGGSKVNLKQIAGQIGARVTTTCPSAETDIDRICAGDKMSDLISAATRTALLVTNLDSAQVLNVARLMDVPGVCLLSGNAPRRETVNAAERQGTTILVSPVDMFETCGRLYQCLKTGTEEP